MAEQLSFDPQHPDIFARQILETQGYFTGSGLTKMFREQAHVGKNQAREFATTVTSHIISALQPEGIVTKDLKGLKLGRTQRLPTSEDSSTPDIYFNAEVYKAEEVQQLYFDAEQDRKEFERLQTEQREEEQKRLAIESQKPARISFSLVAFRSGTSLEEVQDYLAAAEEEAGDRHIRLFDKSLEQNKFASVATAMISDVEAVEILQIGITPEALREKIVDVRNRLTLQAEALDLQARDAARSIIEASEAFSTTRRGLHFFTPVLLLRPFVPLVANLLVQEKSAHGVIADVLITDSYPQHLSLPEHALLGWVQRENLDAPPEDILTDDLIVRGIFADMIRVGFVDRSYERGSLGEHNAISLAEIAERCSYDDIVQVLGNTPFVDTTDLTQAVATQKDIATKAWAAARNAKPKDRKNLEAEAKRQQNAIAPLNARLNAMKIANGHPIHAKLYDMVRFVVDGMIQEEQTNDQALAQAARAKALYDLLSPYFVDNELEFRRALRSILNEATI